MRVDKVIIKSFSLKAIFNVTLNVVLPLFVVSSIFSTNTALALSDDLKKDYETFKKDYSEALNLTNDKNEFLNNFKKTETKLLQQFNTYNKKEGQQLTHEGNQMALDIENLEPLRIIASGQASPESCSNARFINELNNADDKKMYLDIQNRIEKICK